MILTVIRPFSFPMLKSLLIVLQTAIVFFVWNPSKFIKLENAVELKISSDVILYTSVLLLFFALISVYLKLNRQNEQITRLVRHAAIQSAKKPQTANIIKK